MAKQSTSRLFEDRAKALVLVLLLALAFPASVGASTHASNIGLGPALLVGIDRGASGRVAAAVSELGGVVTENRSAAGFLVVQPPQGDGSTDFERALAVRSGVRFLEPQSFVHAELVPDDPGYLQQWGMTRIGMPAAWDVVRGDASVKIAVVDSGVELDNPDLIGRIDTRNDYDFVDKDSNASDEYWHGTHVAGILAAAIDNGIGVAGVAPDCMLLPVRVLDEAGDGTKSNLALGIRWAADHGADVINLSLGGSEDSMLVYEAVEYAQSKDCVVVSAAGNESRRGVAFPAAYPGVIGVASVDEELHWSTFSQTGPEVDLAAPGEGVVSLGLSSGNRSTTRVDSGTSMATAHVAGAAALLRSLHPEWSAGLVERRLEESAEDILAVGHDTQSGFGFVRSDRALGVGFTPADDSDDEVPGVPLRSGVVTGSISATTDPGDCFQVEMAADQGIQASVLSSESARIQLRLYAPNTRNLSTARPLDSAVSRTGEPAAIAAGAGAGAGRYFLQVFTASGSAPYRLSWRRGHVTAVSLDGPTSVAWGKTTSLSGALRRSDGTPLTGVTVVAERRPQGGDAWSAFRTVAVSDAGRFSVSVGPTSTTEYQVRFEGVPGELSSASDMMTVGLKASLTAPKAGTGTLRAGKRVTLSGTIKPVGGSVRIHVRRLVADEWVEIADLPTTLTPSVGASRYKVKMKFSKAGTYQLVAVAAQTDRYAETTAKRVVTVVK